MVWDLGPAFVFAMLVIVSAARSRKLWSRWFADGALPNVGGVPPSARPIAGMRLDDNGLGTYSLDLTRGPAEAGDAAESAGAEPAAESDRCR